MATWAPGTKVMDRGLGGGRRTRKIVGAVPHVAASRAALDFVANPNSRDNHPTYYIDLEGNLYGIVHPDRRPWTTAHDIDEEAITFEIANPHGDRHPYPITDAALSTLKRVIQHHAREEGFSRYVLNKRGVNQSGEGFFIAGHRQYHAVACPGDWLWSRWPGIIGELNRGKPAASKPASKPVKSKPAPQQATATKAQWRTIQSWLKRLGRYGGPVDGVPGPNTWRGIQQTVKKYGYYGGPVDGVPGMNTYKGMQMYACDGGGYTGPVDGVLGPNSWAGFVKRLSS